MCIIIRVLILLCGMIIVSSNWSGGMNGELHVWMWM